MKSLDLSGHLLNPTKLNCEPRMRVEEKPAYHAAQQTSRNHDVRICKCVRRDDFSLHRPATHPAFELPVKGVEFVDLPSEDIFVALDRLPGDFRIELDEGLGHDEAVRTLLEFSFNSYHIVEVIRG